MTYVALGSSFAAGIGLGARAPGSMRACRRTVNGYPQRLARMCGLALDDRTCSGATTGHVLRGGHAGQGPQVDGITADTTLVTLTAGGNDVQYVGDLIALALRNRSRLLAALLNPFWRGAQPVAARDFAGLHRNLCAIADEARRRAPDARIVFVSYPAIVGPAAAGLASGLREADAALMRDVGLELDAVTRAAAQASGCTFVDLRPASEAHAVGSAEPWVSGAPRWGTVPFHPTAAGTLATARLVASALGLPVTSSAA